MIEIQEEQMPYKKKTESSTSKASKKSKHKHKYNKLVLFEIQLTARPIYEVYAYCSSCGKLGYQQEPTFCFSWTKEQWLEKYPNAEYIKLPKGKFPFEIKNMNEVR